MLGEDRLHLVKRLRGIGVLLTVFQRLLEQGILNFLQQRRNFFRQLFKFHNGLFTVVTAYQNTLPVCDIARSDLQPERHALHLVLGELPTGAVFGQVDLCAHTSCFYHFINLLRLFGHARLMACHRNDNKLCRRNTGRQYETFVVAMCHNNRADHARRHAP